MKRVNIIKYTKEDHGFSVYLGNGTHHHFTRERDAKKFLVETSSFLTDQLYKLQDLYVSCWNTYQFNWAYFLHNKKTGNQMIQRERTLSHCLENIQASFNITIQRCEFTNGNHFSFTHLMAVSGQLHEAVKILQLFNDKKSNRRQLYSLDTVYEQITQVRNALQNYSTTKAAKIFQMPDRLSDNVEFEINDIKMYAA